MNPGRLRRATTDAKAAPLPGLLVTVAGRTKVLTLRRPDLRGRPR